MDKAPTLNESIIGKTVAEAEAILTGKTIRVYKEDGESFMVTQEINGHRLNVAVENGKIVWIKGWG